MTLSLGKIEMARTTIQFKRSTLAKTEREKIVRNQLQRYEDTYLKYFDGKSGIHRFYYLGTRLMMARLWKMMYDASEPESEEEGLQEPLILYNADVLEIAHQLPCNYRQHGWFFRCSYTQWHAVAYLLIQMCKHTQGPSVDRAWKVLDAAFADWEEGGITPSPDNSKRLGKKTVKTLWQPLLRLLDRARDVRKQALQSRDGSISTDTPSTISTGYDTSNTTAEDLQQPVQLQDGLINDPFFGSTEDLNMEMSWEQLDGWVQNFQNGLYEQYVEYHDKDMVGALNWW
jgi:hypothetical protein